MKNNLMNNDKERSDTQPTHASFQHPKELNHPKRKSSCPASICSPPLSPPFPSSLTPSSHCHLPCTLYTPRAPEGCTDDAQRAQGLGFRLTPSSQMDSIEQGGREEKEKIAVQRIARTGAIPAQYTHTHTRLDVCANI